MNNPIAEAIQNAYGITPEQAAIVQELTSYHAERFAIYQSERRERARVPALHDGRWKPTRVILAAAEDRLRADAPLEFEVSQRLAEQYGEDPQPGCLWVPSRRDLATATASGGGYLVGSDVVADLFVAPLLAASLFTALGIARVPMQGNAVVP